MEKQGKLSSFMDKILPKMQKFQNNTIVSSIMTGMMGAMPVLMTSALIQLIYNFPIPAWVELLQRTGIYAVLGTIVTLCNMTAIFMGFGIGYAHTKKRGCDLHRPKLCGQYKNSRLRQKKAKFKQQTDFVIRAGSVLF